MRTAQQRHSRRPLMNHEVLRRVSPRVMMRLRCWARILMTRRVRVRKMRRRRIRSGSRSSNSSRPLRANLSGAIWASVRLVSCFHIIAYSIKLAGYLRLKRHKETNSRRALLRNSGNGKIVVVGSSSSSALPPLTFLRL